MIALVDTPVWSLAFRRKTASSPQAQQLANLINRNEATIIGAIRQELLSGIRDPHAFSVIRHRMRAFPDLSLTEEHYERAAELYNLCRSRGIQGSNTDFLICAAAELHRLPIFTTDRDFQNFANYLPIQLYSA
jgi:predicted nucleic acid-binding protein